MNIFQKAKQNFDVGYYIAYIKKNREYFKRAINQDTLLFNIKYKKLTIINDFYIIKYNDIVVFEEGVTFRYGKWVDSLKELHRLVKKEKENNFSELQE